MNIVKMLVVAGNMEEFYEFIQKKNSISTVYSYVNSPSAFIGMSKDDLKGIFIGTWYDRPDILRIVTAINVIKGGIPLEVTDKLNERYNSTISVSNKNTSSFNDIETSFNEYRVDQGFLPGQNKTNLEVFQDVLYKLNTLTVDPNEVKDYK